MTRASAVALAAALAAAAGGCGKSSSPALTGQLKQPSSVAVFAGVTIQNETDVLPYVAIANTDRNDLTILNCTDDKIVNAPVQLRPLAIPVVRPALLASTSLGEETTTGGARKPDLLVVVSAGDSKLQIVQTWTPDNTVVDQANGVTYSVELPGDVLDIAPIASPPGTARLVVAITGRRLAIVSYKRIAQGTAELIVPDASSGAAFVVQPVAFEPASLATVPGDPSHVYVATRDPIPSGATTVFGVAELDVSAPAGPWPARALGARAPTRLVAAAALHAEGREDVIATDTTPFAGQPPVTRVYAVLDEGSCGHEHAIDCGVVALDPALDTATRGHSIPDDWTSGAGERWMPYRAPIQLAARPLAIAVAQPPAVPPSTADADQVYHGDFMRLSTTLDGTWATTAIGAVAAADGQIHFLDLGRFKEASNAAVPPSAIASVSVPATDNRLWLQDVLSGAFADDNKDAGAAKVRLTPGWSPGEAWIVQYQGPLPGLLERRADAGSCASPPGCPGITTDPAKTYWVAFQFGGPGPIGAARPVTEVARLFHPALGVHAQDANGVGGDLVVIRAASVGGDCVGKVPPETLPGNEGTTPKEFEVEIAQLFPPDVARPGGFVTIKQRKPLTGETPATGQPDDRWPLWDACFKALTQKIDAAPSNLVSNMTASIRSQELLLSGPTLGYAGRPAFGQTYTVQYRDTDPSTGLVVGPDENALAAACPLVDWDGGPTVPTCGGGTCDRAVCERALLARKFRRVTHVAENCGTDSTAAVTACINNQQALQLSYPSRAAGVLEFPVANGPALQFRVDLENVKNRALGPGDIPRDRRLSLAFTTTTGLATVSVGAGAVISPNGLITFDRSVWSAAGSYRFLAAYPAGLVVDASPVDTPISNITVR